MPTKVVNLRDDSYTVYIGRGSIWGNPFKIGQHGTRKEVIIRYEEYIREKLARNAFLRGKLLELDGKVLGCYCKPEACHGDILKKLIKEYKRAS